MPQAKKQRKGIMKKKWFTVITPTEYGAKEIAEIAAFEPDELVGRVVEYNMTLLSGNPRDQGRWIYFVIDNVQGEKANTVSKKLITSESYVQRMARRYKQRILLSNIFETKDGKKVQVKLMGFAVKKLHRPVNADITHKIFDSLKAMISSENIAEIFSLGTMDKLLSEAKKESSTIYPLDKLILHKMFAVK